MPELDIEDQLVTAFEAAIRLAFPTPANRSDRHDLYMYRETEDALEKVVYQFRQEFQKKLLHDDPVKYQQYGQSNARRMGY